MLRDKIQRAMKRFADRNKQETSTVEYKAVEEAVVLSECRELSIWVNTEENNLGTQAELRNAQKQLEALEEKLSTTQSDIEKMNSELEHWHTASVRELQDLRTELEVLFLERSNELRNESEDDLPDIDFDELKFTPEEESDLDRMMREVRKIREYNASFEKNRKAKRNAKKQQKIRAEQCKKLFQKIAKKTHPDKVTDERLHEMFKAAYTAYEENDLETLEMIWKEIDGKGSWLMRSLLSRLREVQDKIQDTRESLAAVKKSEDYHMLTDYKLPESQPRVREHFHKKIKREIAQTIMAIRSLDPERHKPEPALSHDKFKTKTSSVMDDSNAEELSSPWGEEEE